MNVIFSIILVASLVLLTFTEPTAALSAMLGGIESSLAFAVTLLAGYGIWVSVMKIWEKCGLNEKIGRVLRPAINKIFPNEGENTYKYLAINLSANILGMGGAATPAGIDATTGMTSRKNRIMLAVINGTSVQILPTTVLAMRAAEGATTDILLPSIIASIATTIIGVLLVKVLVRK